MTIKPALPISSCWVVSEGLAGLQNQAIGMAEALGVAYEIKVIKKPKFFWQKFTLKQHGLTPPWPDLLVTCGRQSGPVSAAIRRASKNKTFTVHIQDPFMDPRHFDVVIVPEHDAIRGKNVFVTKGSVHHVNEDKLLAAAAHFRPLLTSLPRPLISVLVGGKNKHQGFTEKSSHEFAQKLKEAAMSAGGGLAITTSRRTGSENEAIFKKELSGIHSYFWDGAGENPYLGLLSLADIIVVTSDSISMLSEACSTGKPVYVFDLPNGGRRHREFLKGLIKSGVVRLFTGKFEIWKNTALDETRRAASFVYERFLRENRNADIVSRITS